MRTTLDLPDDLLRHLKAQAALEGTTLKQLVLTLVERGLNTSARTRPESARSTLPTLALNKPLMADDFSTAGLFGVLVD
ncbi:MAG: hypothetical protein HEQ37_17520 [Acidovorax sp.]|nr:hypothetical protein [Acidovorax sp.]